MRVLAVNDISCIGKCSLSVTLPILSACGITCDILPTALLSTHTGGFTGYTFRDLTEDIKGILSHWKTLGVQFDVIYSGYLGSKEQIRLLSYIKQEFLAKKGLFIVDPVMGDSGCLYDGFDDSYVVEMRNLCKTADYILPNFTEACFLAGVTYGEKNLSLLFKKLQTLCPRPIVTGIVDNNENSVYFSENGKIKRYFSENVEGFFCGAGDVFASAFVGAIARGKSEKDALRLATDFVSKSIRRSAKEVADKRYGLNFEKEIYPFLKKLNS